TAGDPPRAAGTTPSPATPSASRARRTTRATWASRPRAMTMRETWSATPKTARTRRKTEAGANSAAGTSGPVVRVVGQHRRGAIELLGHQQPHQHVRQGQRAQ